MAGMYDSPPFGGLPVKFYKLGGVRFRPDGVASVARRTLTADTASWAGGGGLVPIGYTDVVRLKSGEVLEQDHYLPYTFPHQGPTVDGNTP